MKVWSFGSCMIGLVCQFDYHLLLLYMISQAMSQNKQPPITPNTNNPSMQPYNSYNHNNTHGQYEFSGIRDKVDQIRSTIRNRHHQQYFQNVRNSMQGHQNQHNPETISPQIMVFMPQQHQYPQNIYTQTSTARTCQNYSIKLNNQQQLYPISSQSTLASYTQQSSQQNKSTGRNNRSLNIQNIQFSNLNQLANLYNILHSGTFNTKPEITHPLINRILQQIQSILLTMKSLYQLSEVNSTQALTAINDSHYNEQSGLLFMLLILYKQLQTQLVRTNTNTIYRWKLMEMAKDCGQFGMKMLGQFGIQSFKAIQY